MKNIQLLNGPSGRLTVHSTRSNGPSSRKALQTMLFCERAVQTARSNG